MNDERIMEGLSSSMGALAPKAAMVLGVLVGGLLAAWIAKRVAGWLVRKSGLEALAERAGAAKFLYQVGAKDGIVPVVQRLVWYAGLLVTAGALAEMLGLGSVGQGIGIIMGFIPRLFAGAVVMFGGMWMAGFIRSLIQRMGRKGDDAGEPNPLAQVAYFGIITVSATIALEQAGIEIGLLASILQLVVGAAVLAIALAFALGGKETFSHLIARHYYRSLVRPGDRLKFREVEGTVARVTSVAIIVTTADAEHVIPCRALLEGVAEIRRMQQDD